MAWIVLFRSKAAGMIDAYVPKSDFLKLVGSGSVPLTGSDFADSNLRRLIELTSDSTLSNRDWATFLLSHATVDTAEIRAALHLRLEDESEVVQEEAMVGLAIRNDISALPVLLNWIRHDGLSVMILEAAAAFAEPSLCQLLQESRNCVEEYSLQLQWQEAWTKCKCAASSA